MLKNIKSKYITKILFLYLDEERKLKLVKYNKSLQKNIGISIINYKLFTGKYIIYESNGFGKEYNYKNNKFLFEGEYLNGEKNGKGKEYLYNGKLIFEGEYLNGKRNGKGKEYYEGKLRFEGEYSNGKRNGKGKEYYEGGNLKFEGKYLNDKEWIGTRYDGYGNVEYKLNNNINGKGKEYKYGTLIFEGEYLNGLKWNGKIYDYCDNDVTYELKDGKGLIKEYTSIFRKSYFEYEYLNI